MIYLRAQNSRTVEVSASSPVIQPVMRNAGNLLIDRLGAPIPTDRCFKCNCSARHEVRKTFTSTGGFMRYLVVLQPLLIPVLLPFFLMRQKRISVAFGICGDCQERRHLGLVLGVAFLIASVPLFVYGVLTITTIGPVAGFAGATLSAAGLLTMVYSRHLADSKHIDGRWIVLSGGGQPFLETIPEAPQWSN